MIKTKVAYYDKEKVLKNLKEFIEELGHIPTRIEYTNNKRKPAYSWFGNNFGSFENALNKIGYSGILSNVELLNILKEYKNKNDKSPKSKDMKNSNGLPSLQIYYDRFNTHSWNEILKLAGLEYNHFQNYTKEDGIKQIKEFYNIHNKLPLREDFQKYNMKPRYDWYYDRYGSLQNLFFQIGLIDRVYTKKEKIQISIDELIKLANKLNRCPTVFEYEQIKHDGFVRRDIERKLGLKYNDICKKYLPNYKLNNEIYEVSKEDLIEELTLLKNKLNINSHAHGS